MRPEHYPRAKKLALALLTPNWIKNELRTVSLNLNLLDLIINECLLSSILKSLNRTAPPVGYKTEITKSNNARIMFSSFWGAHILFHFSLYLTINMATV